MPQHDLRLEPGERLAWILCRSDTSAVRYVGRTRSSWRRGPEGLAGAAFPSGVPRSMAAQPEEHVLSETKKTSEVHRCSRRPSWCLPRCGGRRLSRSTVASSTSSETLLRRWGEQFLAAGAQRLSGKAERTEVDELRAQVTRLEWALGRKTMGVEIAGNSCGLGVSIATAATATPSPQRSSNRGSWLKLRCVWRGEFDTINEAQEKIAAPRTKTSVSTVSPRSPTWWLNPSEIPAKAAEGPITAHGVKTPYNPCNCPDSSVGRARPW